MNTRYNAALILGYKAELSDETRNAYAHTGAMHVLAVSGCTSVSFNCWLPFAGAVAAALAPLAAGAHRIIIGLYLGLPAYRRCPFGTPRRHPLFFFQLDRQ